MDGPARVRFAPSPTGHLHVGGLRTALYNYLFARKTGGAFVLRIEDTDRARHVPGAEERLIDSLGWTGLRHDEGPDVGGDFGPYRQSERLAFYREAAEELLASGAAYRCFCTPARLEEMRRGKSDTRYDRTCARLPGSEADARAAGGDPHTIRLRIPDGETVVVEDLIHGAVSFDAATIDDQVLLKSDGYPTYHLANVVDDQRMGITHVIRGEEWLISAPKHILLYRALAWSPPRFAHLPLLLNSDRTKLSKRQGDVAVEDYREQGYFPEALVNFVAFLGWNPGDDREIFSLAELVEAFTLERVNRSGAIFNLEKLRWFNQEYMKIRPVRELAAALMPALQGLGGETPEPDYLEAVLRVTRDRLPFLHDLPRTFGWFLREPDGYDPEVRAKRWKPGLSAELLQELLPSLERLATFEAPAIEEAFRSLSGRRGVAVGEIVHPVRLAVSGVGRGPGLYEMLEVLGRERSVRRIRRAIEELG